MNTSDKPIHRSRSWIWQASAYLLLCVCAIVMLVPFAYILCASFKTTEDAYTYMFLPRGDGWLGVAWGRLTLSNVRRLITKLHFGRSFFNSAFLASVTATLATLASAMGGYALAKFEFPKRELLTNLVLATLVVPSVILLAPTYQLLYWFGLLDSYAGLILPAMGTALGVYLFRQAMISSVPNELLDASRVDGAGEIRIFFSIVLPLVRPMLGAFLMIMFLGTWNNFIGPQVVLQSPEKFPLSVAVAQLKGVYGQDIGLMMAGTMISVAPVMGLFLLLQKDFVAGLTSGAVKG